jgi:hypothetical protein
LRDLALAPPDDQKSVFVLWERVGLVRDELAALADELGSADVVDPRTMFELQRLLRCGCGSPLLNRRLSASELVSTVQYLRFRIVTAPLRAEADERPFHSSV